MSTRVRALLAENVYTALFLCGAATFYAGVAHFSIGAANIAAGLLLMAIATRPYLRRTR